MRENLRTKLWIPAALLAVLLLIDPLHLQERPVLCVLLWAAALALAVYALLPLLNRRGRTDKRPEPSYAVVIVTEKFRLPASGVYPIQNGELVLPTENGSTVVFQQSGTCVAIRALGAQEVSLPLELNEYYTFRRKLGAQEQICFQAAVIPY